MNIENWLRINLGPIKWQSGDTEMTVNCPFCPNDTGYHLNIHVTKMVCNCFRCGYTGSWYDLIKEISGVESAAEIMEQLQSPTISPISDYISVAERLARRRKLEAVEALDMPSWFQPFSLGELSLHGAMILEYALTRLSLDQIVQYNVGYCTDMYQAEALRLIIPIEEGYFQARAISQHVKPKYTNPPISVGSRLFNAQALVKYKTVIVVEGAISSIASGPNSVATLGNKATYEQLSRLVKSAAESFLIAYDAGQEYGKPVLGMADTLRGAGKLVKVRQFKSGDPADNTGYVDVEYGASYRVMAGAQVKRRR